MVLFVTYGKTYVIKRGEETATVLHLLHAVRLGQFQQKYQCLEINKLPLTVFCLYIMFFFFDMCKT